MDAKPLLLTTDQVLRVFHHDEIYLFLGAAFSTVGLVAVALAFLGRKFNSLLLWLGLFAFLYGNRLWLQTGLLAMMVPQGALFPSLRDSSNYLVPIPAFFYFRAAGFVGRKGGLLIYPLTGMMLALFMGVFVWGPLPDFRTINNVAVITALIPLTYGFMRLRTQGREFRVLRFGLLIFVTLAFWDNFARLHRSFPPGWSRSGF